MNQNAFKTILEFIKSNPVSVLSTVATPDKANSAAMYIVSDEHLNVYFATKKDTKKYHNLMTNPSVAFTNYKELDLTTLQMVGEARLIDPAKDSKIFYELYESIRDKIANFNFPISKVEAGEYAVFKAEINHAVLTSYGSIDGVIKEEYER